jgi:hypothetical protein
MYYYTMVVFFRILFLTVEFHFVKLKRPAAGMIQLMFITSNSPDTLYFYASENIFSGTLRLFLFNWTIFI